MPTYTNSEFTKVEDFCKHCQVLQATAKRCGIQFVLNYEDSLVCLGDWESDYFDMPQIAAAMKEAQPRTIVEFDAVMDAL